jgi:RNA polymerase sigma-70 factor (ECF subfamily)
VAGPEAAQDVTQDALLAAWRELPSLRDPDRFLPWLRRILVNRARDVGRGQRRLGGRPVSLDSVPAQRLELDPINETAPRVDGLTDLHRALARLTIDQRAVIALHYLADLTLPDVATTLGIPLGTAKSRLNAALVVLRRDLGEQA